MRHSPTLTGLFRAAKLALPCMLLCSPVQAQVCLLSEDFEALDLPAGWDIGPVVERIGAGDTGTGEFVPAWRSGNSQEANAGGYFPVPDGPADNRFIMANDDAAPCNCDLDSARLTSPPIDLDGAGQVVATFRYFMDGNYGGDSAWVEVSTDGTTWVRVTDLPAGPDWQYSTVDISIADGANAARLRFQWTDRGGWATGFALDDLCVRGRAARDLAMHAVRFGDLTSSPFNSAGRGLDPSEVPVGQASAPVFSLVVRNMGYLPLFDIHGAVTLALNGVGAGTWSSDTIDVLEADAWDTLLVHTDWTATGPGMLTALAAVASSGSDDVPGDTSATTQRRLTAAGWADGDGAYAQRTGPTLAGLDAEGAAFITGCRYEMAADDAVHGIGVRLDAGSVPGARIVGRLLDSDLQPIASTDTIVVTEADVLAGIGWGWSFLPFSAPVAVSGGTDVLAMVEQIPDSGLVRIALGGEVRPGTGLFRELNGQVWSYPLRAPLVRMHLASVAAGVTTPAMDGRTLTITHDSGSLRIDAGGPVMAVRVLDAAGRIVLQAGPANGVLELPMTGLAAGAFTVTADGPDGPLSGRFLLGR